MPDRGDPEHPPLRVEPDYIERLEGWCDEYNEPLETLRSFILPGGSPAAAELHVARTVTRRAERSAWAAIDEHGATMNVLTAKYLNRLSDLLFILARYANRDAGDVLWVPGGDAATSGTAWRHSQSMSKVAALVLALAAGADAPTTATTATNTEATMRLITMNTPSMREADVDPRRSHHPLPPPRHVNVVAAGQSTLLTL